MPKHGDCMLIKRQMILSTEQDLPVYACDATEMTPREAIKAGWKLKHFVSYGDERKIYREYYFVWPDLFKDAVLVGMSANVGAADDQL